MAKLVEIHRSLPVRNVTLVGRECVIGRGSGCDITVADQRISRRHARVVRTTEGFCLEDLGSVNGTYLNHRRVHGMARLCDGDEIVVGSARFVVDLSDEECRDGLDGRVTIVDGNCPAGQMVEVAHVRPAAAIAPKSHGVTDNDPWRRIERLERELHVLYRLSETVASVLEPGELLHRVVAHLLDVFPQAERAAAVVLDPRSGRLRTTAQCRRGDPRPGEIVLPSCVIDRVVRQGHSVLLRWVPERSSNPNGEGRVTLVSVVPGDNTPRGGERMGAPLVFEGQTQGILYVQAVSDGVCFDQDDLDLLGGIAVQTAVALHLTALHRKLLVRDRIEKDLVIAREIQRNLLPRQPPDVTGIQFAVHYEPAFHVGGDFFDFLWFDPTHLGLLVGDVSGKAVSGALFMARVASEFRVHAPLEATPRCLLQRVNHAVAAIADNGMFSTAVLISIDLETHIARCSNAGHTTPLLRRGDRVIPVEDPKARTLPLGIEKDIQVDEIEVQLEPGDVLLLYTDGLLEARDPAGNLYGQERLARTLAHATGTAQAIVDALLADVDAFTGQAHQSDDQTVVCVQVTAPSSHRCQPSSVTCGM